MTRFGERNGQGFKTERIQKQVLGLVSNYGILIAFILFMALISIVIPNFWNSRNLANVIRLVSINGFLAIGMTFVILTGGIDLSVGSTMGAVGIATALLVKNGFGIPWYSACIAGLLLGAVIGLFNGFVISYLRIPAFVTTLGVQNIIKGFSYVLNDAKPVSGLSENFLVIGGGSLIGIPIPTWLFLGVVLLSFVLFYRKPFGRYVLAIGGNEEAARASGISVKKYKLLVYVISGFMAAVTGIIMTSRVTAGVTSTGEGCETDAIAAVVIGGSSLSGGKGRLWGTIVGILFITIISNVLDLLVVNAYIQRMVKGGIIILAVLIDRVSSQNNG